MSIHKRRQPGWGALKPLFLSIDLGTNCGYALRSGANTMSGTWDFKGRRHEGGGMRYVRFRGALEEVKKAGTIGLVFYEEVRRHRGTDAAHVYGGLLAVLTSWCEENGIAYQGVPVQAIKKHVTGKGNADKDAVIAGVRKFGFSPADDNEADALALMLLKLEAPEVAPFL